MNKEKKEEPRLGKMEGDDDGPNEAKGKMSGRPIPNRQRIKPPDLREFDDQSPFSPFSIGFPDECTHAMPPPKPKMPNSSWSRSQ
jgi:hypothetical protein